MIVVKAEFKSPTPGHFTQFQTYTSIVADSGGVIFIDDNPVPRHKSWNELTDPAQWEILSIETEQLAQIYP